MDKLSTDGKYTVSKEIFEKIKTDFYAGCCDDNETKTTIKTIKDEYSYTADTHTAVGIKVYSDYIKETGDNTKTVIASTANPYKFNKSVLEALDKNQNFDDKDEFKLLDMLFERSGLEIPSSLKDLKNKDVRFTCVTDKGCMKDETNRFLD